LNTALLAVSVPSAFTPVCAPGLRKAETTSFPSRAVRRKTLRPEWPALLPGDDHLPRPLRVALDNLDAQIRKIHEDAALAA
jgi:hypothetical protein